MDGVADGALTTLLDGAASRRELELAAAALHDRLTGLIAPLDDDAPGTALPDGHAIAPATAATCTRDAVRTAMFLRGVHDALRELPGRFPGTRIEVIYAGTGPLASLVLPLIPRFAAAPIRFTFLDVHRESVDAVRTILDSLHLRERVACVATDATQYVHGRPIHLVVIEAMQRAVTREPQVALVRQLAPQLAPGGILVPESVQAAMFLDAACVATVLDLTIATALSPIDRDGCLPAVWLTLPPFTSGRAALQTTIRTYGGHLIRHGESGLTMPQVLWEVGPSPRASNWTVRYQLGPRPGFLCEPAG